MKKKLLDLSLGAIPLVAFFLLWEFFISTSTKTRFLFASPSLVLEALLTNLRNGVLLDDILTTGTETLAGFLIGNLTGAVLGLSLWYSKRLASLVRPYIIAVGAVPIFAIAPMMIIWFGTDLFAKIMMSAISTITVAITQSYEGARNVDPQQVQLMRSFGASDGQVFLKLVVPSSLVWLLNSLKLNVTFAILGAFIGEFISASSGLGYRILKAGGLYDIPLVLAAVFCLILMALFFSFLIFLFERTVVSWK